MSTEELMQAARYLIELSKNDYVVKEAKGRAWRPDYFSYEVDYAFHHKQMQVAKYEGRIELGIDGCGLSPEVSEKIYRLRMSSDELRWEF